MNTIIAPSLLSANFLSLEQEIEMINNSQAEYLHLDIMDGVFVPNITFGMPIIKQIRKACTKKLDVHLMIEKPERYIQEFADCGADILTVHYEASTHLNRTLTSIREAGMKSAVALNPHSPVSLLQDSLAYCDMVLIMSVNPGFGGQSFIPNSLNKLRSLKQMIDSQGLNTIIEVDGGVNLQNAKSIIEAGAQVLVAGNAVFKSENPTETIKQLLKN